MFTRRQTMRGLMAGAATSLFAGGARALDYPTRAVKVLIPVAAGGTSDVLTRLTSRFWQEKFGQPFVIDNRPGAGGNLAAAAAFSAPGDGYTLLSIPKGNIFANLLYEKLDFDFQRDFKPVAGIANGSLVMLMHPSVPARTLPEFIAYAKANPTKINYGTPGNSSDPHLAAELLKMMAGIEMTHVPYRGGALAMNDLIAGNVQVMFSNLPVGEYINQGKLVALGVTSLGRSKEFPDITPISTVVPGYEVGAWYAYVARKDTPKEVIDALNSSLAVGFADPAMQKSIAVSNASPMSFSTEELEKLFAAEYDKWSKVIKAAKIKPD